MSANAQWLFHLPLLKDELLSSWLVRVAFAHGCDPLTLTGCLWPEERVWTTDIDRSLSLSHLAHLSSIAHIPLDILTNATLKPLIQQISGTEDTIHNTAAWILSLGSRNRKHKGGLQICPLCLEEAESAYYQRSWRKAWYIYCPNHHCMLVDRCPACHSAIQPHRLNIPDCHLTACALCGFDLSAIKPDFNVKKIAINFQNNAESFIAQGHAELNQAAIPLSQWFSLASHYIHLIRHAYRSDDKPINHFLSELGINTESVRYPENGLAFELCRTEERVNLLNDVSQLLDHSPNKIIGIADKYNISKSIFDIEKILYISESEGLSQNQIGRKKQPSKSIVQVKSKIAVIRMWNRLLRKI